MTKKQKYLICTLYLVDVYLDIVHTNSYHIPYSTYIYCIYNLHIFIFPNNINRYIDKCILYHAAIAWLWILILNDDVIVLVHNQCHHWKKWKIHNLNSANFPLKFRHLFLIDCNSVWDFNEVRLVELELSITMDSILQGTNQIGEGKIECQICKEEFDQFALDLHINTHHNDKSLREICEICEKRFKTSIGKKVQGVP